MQQICALAVDTKVETPEGALTIKGISGKAVAVFTREPDGRIRFRMTLNSRKVAEQQPVLRITLENGQSFRVGRDQVVFKKGMVECRADALQSGDELVPAFHYPEGYEFRDDVAGARRVSSQSLQVRSVEDAGTADLYTLGVRDTGCFFVSAGVLCKAESA
jgi:hypothetical protein